MENYSYTSSYPDFGDASPPSRDIDFDTMQPWEDQPPPAAGTYIAKFMCSFGGKIHPRPHDNQLSYIGGDTKILAVDCNIKFSGLIANLSASICNGEDLGPFVRKAFASGEPETLLHHGRLVSDQIRSLNSVPKMNDADVSKQIQQMVRFIRQEAAATANEISVSAAEEFNIAKFQLHERCSSNGAPKCEP